MDLPAEANRKNITHCRSGR